MTNHTGVTNSGTEELMRQLNVPIGVSDFKMLRESGKYYVDKTGFIRDVLLAPQHVLLFPRPRRFGKSLNMSMLRYFLERSPEDRSPLFEGLEVMKDERCVPHFQRYPVIHASLGKLWISDRVDARDKLREEVRRLYSDHEYLLTHGGLKPYEKERFQSYLERRADESALCGALLTLSELLHKFHGQRVFILVDEYDTPLSSAYVSHSYAETVGLIREFLLSGIKDNPHLHKGVLTGVLRVARESIFSGLNNVVLCSILEEEFATSFGFTEPEVQTILRDAALSDRAEEVREWYQGYLFGGQSIYNPWSVLNLVRRPKAVFRNYWAKEGADDISEPLSAWSFFHCYDDFQKLMQGIKIRKRIEEHTALRQLSEHPEAVWSILTMAGYLRAEPVSEDEDSAKICDLSFPNKELQGTFPLIFKGWMSAGFGSKGLVELEYALLQGNAIRLEALLDGFLGKVSNHDLADVEAHYHIFLLGLLVLLDGEHFQVRSNRESGLGRCDLMLLPKKEGSPGVVIELKVLPSQGSKPVNQDKVDATLDAAMVQIATLQYARELRERGASPIHEIAIVFSGKRVWVRSRSAAPTQG